VLAHLHITTASMPTTLRLLAIDIDSGAKIERTPELATGWQANQATTQTIGNAWLAGGKSLLLRCPSAVLPESFNFLINPLHKHAKTHLQETDFGPIWVDQRLVAKR
jgi:RES domain-containing protein